MEGKYANLWFSKNQWGDTSCPTPQGRNHTQTFMRDREGKGEKGKRRNEGTQSAVGLCQSGHTGENICCIWGCVAVNQSTSERRIADGCALANVALGNLGYWYSIWSLFYHPQLCILCCCQGTVFPDDNRFFFFFWQVKALCHTAKKMFMNGLMTWEKKGVDLKTEHWWNVLEKLDQKKWNACMFYLRTYRN